MGVDIEKIEYLFRPIKIDTNSNIGDIILIYLKSKDKLKTISAINKLDPVYAELDYFTNK